MDARDLFRAELARRGAVYTVAGDGRWIVAVGGMRLLVSLDNLDRQLAGNGDDAERIAFFADQLLEAAQMLTVTAVGLYWFAEPNDYVQARRKTASAARAVACVLTALIRGSVGRTRSRSRRLRSLPPATSVAPGARVLARPRLSPLA